MPLSPANDDKNRKNEQDRKRSDPGSFGVRQGDNSRERKSETMRERDRQR